LPKTSLRANGDRIRRARERASLSQEGLANKAGVDTRTVISVEANGPTTIVTLMKLARVLGVDVETFTAQARIVWVLGSYTNRSSTDRFTKSFLRIVAGHLVHSGARLVVGESTLLYELAHFSRDAAFQLNSPGTQYPVMLFASLRCADLRHLFLSHIGGVPDLAVLVGGNIRRGRVLEEYHAATAAKVPVLALPATGGVARTVPTTAPVSPEQRARLSLVGAAADAGKLALLVSEVLRAY